MSTIWVFGCSFSSGHLDVSKEETYGNLLANEIGYNIKNLASPGASNDFIFRKLISNLKEINDDDIILYQFTAFNRIGFFLNHNEESFFSSAGVPEIGVDKKSIEYPFNNLNKGEVKDLLNYILFWQEKRKKFLLEDPLMVLEFLELIKSIKYYILHMTDEFYKKNKNNVIFPINKDQYNIGMNDFLVEKKLTLSDDFPENHKNYFDSHPGKSGHLEIKNLILKKINE